MLLLHGEAGSWDELAIVVVGFVVIWLAVKLAGRKPADGGDEPTIADASVEEQEALPPAGPPG